jgi:outer membrane protein assembly factor BamB
VRFACALVCLSALASDPWSQWRGPNRDGFATAFAAPSVWPDSLQLQWQAEAGEGYSSPVVSDTSVCLHSRQKDDEIVSCFHRDSGKVLWTARYAAPLPKNQYATGVSGGPFATPVIDGGRLFTFGVGAIVSAYDVASGKFLWRRQPSQPPATSQLFCGTASSPVMEAGRLLIYWGDDIRGGELLALDPASGKTVWSWQGEGPGYAALSPATIGGVRQIVTLSDRTLFAVSPSDGKLLWKVPFPDEWHENIVTPVVAGDLVIASGIRLGTQAFRITRTAGKWSAAKVWTSAETPMYMSTPVLDGAHLYGFTIRNKGQLFCLEVATGKVLWISAGRTAEQASLVAAGAGLLVTAVDGKAWTVRRQPDKYVPGPRYELAAGSVYSCPALAGRQIFIKDQASLKAYVLPAALTPVP